MSIISIVFFILLIVIASFVRAGSNLDHKEDSGCVLGVENGQGKSAGCLDRVRSQLHQPVVSIRHSYFLRSKKITPAKNKDVACQATENQANQILSAEDSNSSLQNDLIEKCDSGFSSTSTNIDSDTNEESSSGSGSSTSSESESEGENGFVEFMPCEGENGRRSTFRPTIINNNDGKPVCRKLRVSLWNRSGNKKETRCLKTPYEMYNFENNEPYANKEEIDVPVFPPLKTVELSEIIKPVSCAVCAVALIPEEQLEHNHKHLKDYLLCFEKAKEHYYQNCLWCNQPETRLTIGYHLREHHPELFFGLSEKVSGIEVIELFCGIGGLSLGLEHAGVKVVAGVDWDGTCKTTFEANHNAPFIKGNIYNVKGKDLEKYFTPGAIRVLVAGVPCITFSGLSKTRHCDAVKYGTLNEFKRVIKELMPDMFVLENVPNIASITSTGYQRFILDMKNAGYYLSQKVLLASQYGTPQHRKRLILLASRYGFVKHPEPFNTLDDALTLRNAIGYLPKLNAGQQHSHDPMHVTAHLRQDTLEAVRYTPVGYRSGHLKWPFSIRKMNLENLEDPQNQRWRTWRHNLYGRMEYDEPSYTITTNAMHPAGGPYTHPDPEQHRGYSVRELMNIQGFPKNMMLDYQDFMKTRKLQKFPIEQAAKHVGNAVPPPLGKAIGLALLKHLEQLKLPLPHLTTLFPVFVMKYKCRSDRSTNSEQARTQSLSGRLARLRKFYPRRNKRRPSCLRFLKVRGRAPCTRITSNATESSSPFFSTRHDREGSPQKQFQRNPLSSAFLPFGVVKMTVPPAVMLGGDLEPDISMKQKPGEWQPCNIKKQKNYRFRSGKRKLPPGQTRSKTKKRRVAGTAGIRGFVCPVEDCKSPESADEQYSLTSAHNWFDHMISKHGNGFVYEDKKFKKLIDVGEAMLGYQKQLKCLIGACCNQEHFFCNFTKLGGHVLTHDLSMPDTLTVNGLWRGKSAKAKPICQLNSHSAGKRYQTRHGNGFVCQEHKETPLAQTPEALGRHWLHCHKGVDYFCPVAGCVADNVSYKTPVELYRHVESHGVLKASYLDFSPLEEKNEASEKLE